MPKLALMAQGTERVYHTIDPATGESQRHILKPHEYLSKHNVPFVATPKNYPVWTRKGKNGPETVTLEDLGLFILCRLDAQGRLVNQYSRSDFNKPMAITAETILELQHLFGGKQRK